MRFFRKITSNPNFWSLLVVVFIGLLAGKGLMGQGYFNMHDDLQMMRQLEMEKCFKSLQIPCRWVPDMGYGFGFPLFNFYPPLPYLVGEIVRLFGVSFVDTVKIVFILAFVASGVAMYFLGKDFFGRLGGIVAAVFYIWAPYHSVDIYVRGAMNEAWALVWFPLIFWTSYKLLTAKDKKFGWIVGLGLSWAALLVSHNLMAMVFAPLFALWCLLWVLRKKGLRQIPNLAVAGILAFGLVAFFTIPVLVEQKYTHANTLIQGYYEYSAHFATIGQILFSRFWGYGPSIWGTGDGMPFQIGHIHWILSFVVLGFVGVRYLKTRKIDSLALMVLLIFIGGWGAAFMMHSRSTPIWQMFKTLNYVQFPWRFLTIVIFCFSFLAGSLPLFLPKKIGVYLAGILAVGLIIWNWNYFLPEHGHLGSLADAQKFSGAAWELQQTAGIYDYLPIAAEMAPRGPQKSLVEIIDGGGEILDSRESTNWATFNTNITSNYALVRINIFQFPNWRVFIDGTEAQIKMGKDEKIGRIYVNVPHGVHQVYVRLYDTWARTLGNTISLIAWVGLIGVLALRRRNPKKFPVKLVLIGVFLLGIVLRYSLVPYGDFGLNGDLDVVGEWGRRFWQIGARSFYSDRGWYYSMPTYPPLSSLMYAELWRIFEGKYVLSQIHNLIRIPPSSFIIDFYARGYNLILKLPAILSDIGLAYLIYKVVKDLTKNSKKAVFAFSFYLLNPLILFLTGVWGQTESLLALFGMFSFFTLYKKKVWLSIPLFFICLYLKPTWVVLAPLYLFLLWHFKASIKQVILGGLISLGIFYIATKPFGGSDLFGFTRTIITQNILPGAKGTAKASISAFNFWTIFMRVDRELDTARFLLAPANLWGWFFYIFVNIFSFSYIRKEKNKLLGVIVGMFIVGMGSFLFLTGILERYFFAAFVPLVILIFSRPKLTFYLVTMNIILFLNLIWAFYRRTSNEIDHPFTNNNFLLIRILSFIIVSFYIVLIKSFRRFNYKLNV